MFTKLFSVICLAFLLCSGCTPEGKQLVREQVKDAIIVAANDNGQEPLWKQFVKQKKANILELTKTYNCIPDTAKKMDIEVQPLYSQAKVAVDDPSSRNIAQLALLVTDFLEKSKKEDIKIDECRIIIETIKLYADKL